MPVLNNVLRRLGHREYLRFVARDRIICFFHNRAKPGAGEFAVPFLGLTYRGKFDTFLDWSVYYYNIKGDDAPAEKGAGTVDFITMDVEGFEVRALHGLNQTLSTFRPIVFAEWTQNNLGEKGVKAGRELFPKGYRFYQFIEEVPHFVLFREKHYRLKPVGDLWENGNVLAVPEEHIQKINARNPLPALAQRLKGSGQ